MDMSPGTTYAYHIDGVPVASLAQVTAAAGRYLDLKCNFMNSDERESRGLLVLAIYDSNDRLLSMDVSESKEFKGLLCESFTASAMSTIGLTPHSLIRLDTTWTIITEKMTAYTVWFI